MSNGTSEKVFYSDMSYTREKVLRFPRKNTEKADVFARIQMELKSMVVEKRRQDSACAFAFERAKMKELHMDLPTQGIDVEDKSVRHVLRQVQENTETSKRLSRRILVVTLLYLLEVACEFIVTVSLLLSLVLSRFPWPRIVIWLGSELTLCGIKLGFVAWMMIGQDECSVKRAWNVVRWSFVIIGASTLFVTMVVLESVFPKLIFSTTLGSDDLHTINQVKGVIICVSVMSVLIQAVLAHLSCVQMQTVGRPRIINPVKTPSATSFEVAPTSDPRTDRK